MKKWLKNLWENVTTGSFVVLGCGLMLIIVVGAFYLVSLLCKWLWTFDWVRDAVGATGTFLFDHAQFFEYLFTGAFLLYLLIIFCLWLYQCIKDGYQYATAHDFFGRTKRLLIKIANIILVVIVIIVFLFFTTDGFKSCSDSHINYENYEHRADRF